MSAFCRAPRAWRRRVGLEPVAAQKAIVFHVSDLQSDGTASADVALQSPAEIASQMRGLSLGISCLPFVFPDLWVH